MTLRADGSASQAELGRRLGIDRSNVHAVINDLVARRLVTRRPDASDPRRNLIAPTNTGKKVLVELDATVDAAQTLILEALCGAQRAELVVLLSKLCGSPPAEAPQDDRR